ncbi:uncharacterized protein RAG0_00871 [Rhynchosporium agropyri]|uniref:Uncharacterized protein n=1 Tax=Rhynchosporium agropyri TaxID=914238 RepID=A0A1E1JUP3_9HELO|nr:uncharacterized protein RAG0_00871 [Rhynchosporium agropyri]
MKSPAKISIRRRRISQLQEPEQCGGHRDVPVSSIIRVVVISSSFEAAQTRTTMCFGLFKKQRDEDEMLDDEARNRFVTEGAKREQSPGSRVPKEVARAIAMATAQEANVAILTEDIGTNMEGLT